MPETGEGIPKTKVAEKANPLPEGGRESSEQSRLNERTGQRRTGASLLRKLLPPPTREDHDLRQSSFKIQEIGAELDGIEAKKTAEVNPAMPAKPLPHEKDNGMNKSIDAKSKEPETEMIVLRDDDGRVVGSFPVRKNATIAELNQAAKASGIDFRVSLVGTALNSPGQAIKDLWNTVKKGYQESAPPPSQPSSEKGQAKQAEPQSHDQKIGAKNQAESNSNESEETEMIVLRDDDGRVVGSFPVRKNATIAELNQAAKASGIDFRVSLVGTALNSPGQAIKDLRNTVKKGKS